MASESHGIPVEISSETGRLECVAMCPAPFWRVSGLIRFALASDPSTRERAVASISKMLRTRIGLLNTCHARAQQEALITAMRERGIEVLIADEIPKCYGQMYTRDVAFAIDDVLYVARPRHPVRRREQLGLRKILAGVPRVQSLDDGRNEDCFCAGLASATKSRTSRVRRARRPAAGEGTNDDS